MSQINAVRTALVNTWTAQLATDGVTAEVRKFPWGDESTTRDMVFVTRIVADQEWETYGRRTEDLTVEAEIWAQKAGGVEVSDDCETAALAILASLETALTADTEAAGGIHGTIERIESDIDALPSAIRCTLSLTIAVMVNL